MSNLQDPKSTRQLAQQEQPNPRPSISPLFAPLAEAIQALTQTIGWTNKEEMLALSDFLEQQAREVEGCGSFRFSCVTVAVDLVTEAPRTYASNSAECIAIGILGLREALGDLEATRVHHCSNPTLHGALEIKITDAPYQGARMRLCHRPECVGGELDIAQWLKMGEVVPEGSDDEEPEDAPPAPTAPAMAEASTCEASGRKVAPKSGAPLNSRKRGQRTRSATAAAEVVS